MNLNQQDLIENLTKIFIYTEPGFFNSTKEIDLAYILKENTSIANKPPITRAYLHLASGNYKLINSVRLQNLVWLAYPKYLTPEDFKTLGRLKIYKYPICLQPPVNHEVAAAYRELQKWLAKLGYTQEQLCQEQLNLKIPTAV